MDVKRGCCWRCEKKIQIQVSCSSCGVAKYCSQRCRERDQWRHKPECENWRPKKCSHCDASGQLQEVDFPFLLCLDGVCGGGGVWVGCTL